MRKKVAEMMFDKNDNAKRKHAAKVIGAWGYERMIHRVSEKAKE